MLGRSLGSTCLSKIMVAYMRWKFSFSLSSRTRPSVQGWYGGPASQRRPKTTPPPPPSLTTLILGELPRDPSYSGSGQDTPILVSRQEGAKKGAPCHPLRMFSGHSTPLCSGQLLAAREAANRSLGRHVPLKFKEEENGSRGA